MLAIVVVALFALTMRPVFADIVRMPGAAAAGAKGAIRRVLKETLKRLGREMLVTFFQVVAIVFVTLLVGALLNLTVAPAIVGFLDEVIATFLYAQSVRGASGGMIGFALVATMLFLVINVAMSVAMSGRGFKALGFLARYKREEQPAALPPVVPPEQAAAA